MIYRLYLKRLRPISCLVLKTIKHLFVIGNVRYKMRWTQTIIPPLFPLERATGQSHKTLAAVCETTFSYPAGRQAKSFNNLLSRLVLAE